MAYLNELENAVLQAMCEREDSYPVALRSQIKSAEVASRQNTGAGFYTCLKLDQSLALLEQKVFDNVFAKISGLNNPMTFVLFVRDGKIDTLEGASVEDNTTDIDFETVRFKIL